MTKKREPTQQGVNTTRTPRKTASKTSGGTSGASERGTAAGLRAGAGSATKAKVRTSATGKQSQKELTQRGGPGRAGTTQAAQKKKGAPRKRTVTRGRGAKAKAGA